MDKILSPIKNRVLQFVEYKKISKGKFFEAIGAAASNFRGSGLKSEIGGEAIAKILSLHKDLNPHWLLTGEGAMLVSNTAESPDAHKVDYNTLSVMYVPLVNQYAYAGYMNGFNDPEYIEELPKIAFAGEREYKGEYVCFEVKGDSMDDGSQEALLEHDLLLCRNVRKDYWKSQLHIKKWDFVIVHREKGIAVKRIIAHDTEKGTITLHSLNDYYDDYVIDLADVQKIFNIVDVKRTRKRK